MKKVTWKENKIISIKLRNGIYTLAQMLKSPYMIFYNLYDKNNNWENIVLTNNEILFYHAVIVKNFLKFNQIEEIINVKYLSQPIPPEEWIYLIGSEKITVWKGMQEERTFAIIGEQKSLVKRDIFNHDKNTHSLGVFKSYIKENLKDQDFTKIQFTELMTLEIYPNLNERLYLCYKLNRYVDPLKEILFNQELPLEYKTYVDIISGQVSLKNIGYDNV